MLITIISKTFGFARDIVLSYFYGASSIADAYVIALTIPGVIFSFVGAGISTGYIPMYSKIEKDCGENLGIKYTNNLINILTIICTIMIILGFIFAEQVVKVFAFGFQGEILIIAVGFTRITIFGIYASLLITIFSGFLQMKENYIIPALAVLPMNLFLILSIFLSSKINVYLLAVGNVIAIASQLILLIPFVRKQRYKYKFVIDIHDKNIKNTLYIVIPVIIGVSVNEINVLVDKTLASNIIKGGISSLNYATRFNDLVQGLFVTSITTAMYPRISKMAAENNMERLKSSLLEAIVTICLLVLPATIVIMLYAEPVVKFIFGRGAFDLQAIIHTSSALFYFSIGMIGFGLRELVSRVFYSIHDAKTPMINAAIGMALNTILNILLSNYMGLDGLALATSIAAIITTGLLLISLRKKIGPFGIKQALISFLKILLASSLMGLFTKLIFNFLIKILNQTVSFLIIIVIGIVSYFVIIYFMNIEYINIMVEKAKTKLGKHDT